MTKVDIKRLDSVTKNDTTATERINDNFKALQEAIENTLSRDGTGPNYMDADLDMNSYRIINSSDPVEDNDIVNLKYVEERIGGAVEASKTAVSAATQAANSAQSALVSSTNAINTLRNAEEQLNNTIEYVDEAKQSIDEAINSAIEDVKQQALDAAQESIDTAAEQATDIVIEHAETVIKPELNEIASNAAEDAANAAESAEIASNESDEAKHWAEDSRVWATGEDAEVEEIAPGEEEHSSRGYADLAMAIANTPEDVPVDTSKLLALQILKGLKGDKGDRGDKGDKGEKGDTPDLTDYVKNTDYATTNKGGTIKAYTQNGFGINNSGQPFSQTVSLVSYKSYGGNFFIGKGTLENIKYDLVKDGVVNNNYSLGDSDKQKVRNWIGASGEVIQQSSLSSMSAGSNVGKIFQYTGETTEEFVNGYFYKSVAGESNYISSDPRNLTFNYDLFWSELGNAGITLDTLRLREEDKTRGGFSIIGLSESETEYRATEINGVTVDVLLTQSVQSSQNIVGTYTRWYYTYSTVYKWEQLNTQPTTISFDADGSGFSGDVSFEGSFNVHGDDNHPVKVTSLAGASASGFQVVDSNGAGESDFEHYAAGDRYGTRIANKSTATGKSVNIDLYQTTAGKSVLDLSKPDTILAPQLLDIIFPIGSYYLSEEDSCPLADWIGQCEFEKIATQVGELTVNVYRRIM